jgi:hypothetical protein
MNGNIKYSDELYHKIKASIPSLDNRGLQPKLDLWKELNHFGDLGVFDNSFVDNEFAEWKRNRDSGLWDRVEPPAAPFWLTFLKFVTLQSTPIVEKTEEEIKREYVENRLKTLPFEKAYWYKNPEYTGKLREDILRRVCATSFNSQEQSEYMCYYVINVRDEIIFDVYDMLYSVQ